MGIFQMPLAEFLALDSRERRKLIGQQIRETRKLYGVSQSSLAASIGVTQPYLSNVERGQKSPSPKTVVSIVDYFQKEELHGKDKDQAHDEER